MTQPARTRVIDCTIRISHPRRLLEERIGYRGASLLMYGLIFFFDGAPLLLDIPDTHPVDHPVSIGIPIWAAGFVAAGLIAIISAFRRSSLIDKIALGALMAVGCSWVTFCIILQVWHWFATRVPTLGWMTIIVDIVIMTKIWIDSGWDEPVEPLGLADRLPT